MKTDAEFAPAKINLTLHVTGQRADGYHELDSLVAFADVGDHLRADPSDGLGLTVEGPCCEGVPTDDRNLVIKAARHLNPNGRAHLTLTKMLPAAAGIGGGSADAAAALRLLSRFWACPLPQNTAILGADVPVCMTAKAQRMQGIGDVLNPVSGLPPLPAVLVNPGVAVSTPKVFMALQSKNNLPMPDRIPTFSDAPSACDWLENCRNDLEAPAISHQPVIQDVLDALSATGARLVRMSGSGATCFGIFATQTAADCAASDLSLNPNWWVQSTLLG